MESEDYTPENEASRSRHRHSPVPQFAFSEPARSTVSETWGWLWKDTVTRVVPLTAAALAYARLSGKGTRGIGLTQTAWRRELALGLALGVPLSALSAAFRGVIAPRYKLPTRSDQALQSVYYLAINAPAEELFWRGLVQTMTADLIGRATGHRTAGQVAGWALATSGYASYHRLGGWSWKSIGGVAFAGGIFGALFARDSHKPSLVAPVVAHGLATAAFLSWGDAVLHWRARRKATEQTLHLLEVDDPIHNELAYHEATGETERE